MELSFAPINKIMVVNGIRIQKELMHYPVQQVEQYLEHLDFKEESSSIQGTFRYYRSEACTENATTVIMIDQNGLVDKVKYFSNSQSTQEPVYAPQSKRA